MRIRRLRIKHFRSVANGELLIPGHTAIVAGNSVGKSTVCEALDLLLGPDRLSRAHPIDEHDFHGRQYLDYQKNPVLIELEVVLTNLTEDLETKYRAHREYWDTESNTLLDEKDGIDDIESKSVVPALRVLFEGRYDIEEDEFSAMTLFASPPPENPENRSRVSRSAKRDFGFIYLRALRTGSRALSLERGSLLDIILRLKEEDRSEMWEQTLQGLEHLDPPIDDIPQLKDVLDEIDGRVRRFVGLSDDDRSLRLYPSALTRDSLRKSMTLFGSSERSNTPVPYWRLGSGVINAIVFSLLTFIAELKRNVIFAMEEPELALPPHTQRRIVQFLQSRMDQAILTTHSPFVLEQFEAQKVMMIARDSNCQLSSQCIELEGIKAKAYKGGLRRTYAEALLGRGVLCVEGISDAEVLQTASSIIEKQSTPDKPYTPLDLSGVTIVRCEGDGELLKNGRFFGNLGFKTYAFFDKQKDEKAVAAISQAFDRFLELEQTGIERLLADSLPKKQIRKFLKKASKWIDYPNGKKFTFNKNDKEGEIRALAFRVLKARKGAGYAQRLIARCSYSELPKEVVETLEKISADLPNDLPQFATSESVEAGSDEA